MTPIEFTFVLAGANKLATFCRNEKHRMNADSLLSDPNTSTTIAVIRMPPIIQCTCDSWVKLRPSMDRTNTTAASTS